MRNLMRNTRQLYYAQLVGERRVVDDAGFETGETVPMYGGPTLLRCNVSATRGQDEVSAFGNFTAYSRTAVVADTSCPMDEDSIVWFGVDPTTSQHNYIVVQRADSKNGLLYALQEVTVR